MSDSSSGSQLCSLTFRLSKWPLHCSQCSVSEMLSGAVSWLGFGGWQSIPCIRQIFNTWHHPPGRLFEDTAGGKGNLSDNVNAATPSCWMINHHTLMISSVCEMYSMAVIWLFWVWQSFCAAHRFWLPCNIFKKSLTLAILCNFVSSTSLLSSKSCSGSVKFNGGWSCPKYLFLGLSKLPYNDFFVKGVTCNWWLPPADHILYKGITGVHFNSMWHNRE